MDSQRAKTPSTEIQAPEKLQIQNSKLQIRAIGLFWSLDFGASLELGA
jgi:hypothetical protein